MQNPRNVSVRELQHNLADYLKLAKVIPLLITKHGKKEALLVNPEKYTVATKKAGEKVYEDIMNSPFIGLHKNNKIWQGKPSSKIAHDLREKAWYGK